MDSLNHNNSAGNSSDEAQPQIRNFSEVPITVEQTGHDFGLGVEGDAYR